MMTDLAALLSAANPLPGASAQISAAGTIGDITAPGAIGLAAAPTATSAPVVASGTVPRLLAATSATAFQAVLAAQVQTLSPIAQPAPISPRLAVVPPSAQAAPELAAQSTTTAIPSRAAVLAPSLALAPIPVGSAPAEAPALTAAGVNSTPAAPGTIVQSAPVGPPTRQPATLFAIRAADGKLPTDGNILPVSLAAVAPRAGVAKTADDDADDPTTDPSPSPIGAIDPAAQPLLAAIAIGVQPVSPPAATTRTSAAAMPPPGPARAAAAGSKPVEPAQTRTIAPDMPEQVPSAGSSPTAAPSTFAVAQAPSVARGPTTATAPAIAPVQSAPALGSGAAAVSPQPVVIALAAPVFTNAAPVAASLSTASRLARQSEGPRDADSKVPTGAGSGAASPAAGVLPLALSPTDAAPHAASPAATPPQDFAVLVDRLLEARASAQSSSAPQQISTTVTHADFGKVSLNFQHHTAGLSVSMTSADPGFARAAQAAIASSDTISAGAVQTATAGQLSIGQPGNQGFTQPSALAQLTPGATGQAAAGFSTADGGSQQSQPQPQQRPGFIAAATRAPIAARGRPATGPGIFA